MSTAQDVIKKFRETVRRLRLVERGDSIVIGLSGGPDSVVLTHLLKRLEKEYQLQLFAVHINHKLRGRESDQEAVWVKKFCEKLNLPCEVIPLQWVSSKKRNLQEVAREKRYEKLFEMAVRFRATKMATAHHADDQFETVLMRFLEGAGLEGLAGIPPKRTILPLTPTLSPKGEGVIVVRPLILLTKKEILTYTRSHKLTFMKDSSNKDPKYWRNHLRLKVIPCLQKEAPQLATEISRMSLKLRDDLDYLNSLAETVYEDQVGREEGARQFPLGPFKKLPSALQARLLKKALAELEAPVRGISHHLETMLALIQGEKKNGRYALPGGYFFEKSYGFLQIVRR